MNSENSSGRRLGRSKLTLSAVGLGCWQFSQGQGTLGHYWPTLSDEAVREIVSASLDGGVNWFDTAEFYGNGASERILSRSLRQIGKKPGEVIIATKWSPQFRTAAAIGKTIHRRRKNLDPYPIDLHQIHNPASFSTVASQMKAMADLVRAGSIRAVGVSNFSAGAMKRAHSALADLGLPLVSNQVHYSLLHRKIETNGVMDTAAELGISIIAYSPLAQGVLTGRFHDIPTELSSVSRIRRWRGFYRQKTLERSRPLVEALKEVARTHGATPAQVALRWLLDVRGDMVVVIPGATRKEQAIDNAAAMKFRLSRDEIDQLDRLSFAWR
jgi:aryl-alcohol dehydrogenase-like predicted oxidoreductase